MKLQLLALLLFVQSGIALGSSATCQWIKSSDHAPNFYKPAVISFEIKKEFVILLEDSFLYRTYEPCWIGNYSSCAFGFDYDRQEDWKIIIKEPKKLIVEAPGFYWDAQLILTFSKKLMTINSGSKFQLSLSGDDGDGVKFKDQKFKCEAF